ncbi:hypothetical protein VULLAG_LOCUS21313 [Vulpes lagopus]
MKADEITLGDRNNSMYLC